LTFTPAADAGSTDRDVLIGYQMFLGRDPESSFVIADAKNSPVGAFIRALMSSGEFQSAVLDKLAAGRPVPHESASTVPSPEHLDWLFRYIQVPGRAEKVLRAATSWGEWLRTIVAVPGFPNAPSRASAAPDGVQARDAADGFVLINVDQPKPGDRLTPGSLIQGSGWAIAPSDVAEVAIELDGKLLTHARYGLPRPDVARRFPHYRHVDHCGFSFSAEIPPDIAPGGASVLSVSVRTLRGETGQKGVRLVLPAAPTAAQTAGPAGADGGDAAWPIRLAVEEAVVDPDRRLRLRGWAVSAATMGPIVINLGDTAQGETRIGLPRPDIATAHPNYANAAQAGFAFTGEIPAAAKPGPSFVRVQASDAAGQARQTIIPITIPPLSLSPIPVTAPPTPRSDPTAPPSDISFACDAATLTTDGVVHVAGWAIATSGEPVIRVDLGGITLGEARLGGARPDVGARFPKVANAAQSGFAFIHQLPRRPKKGVHTLSLLVTSPAGARCVTELPLVAEAPLASSAKPLPGAVPPGITATPARNGLLNAPPELNVPRPLPPRVVPGLRLEVDRPTLDKGSLEEASAREPVRGALTIAGWAAGRAGVEDVSIYCDERLLGHAHLGMRREDIGAAFPEYKGSLLAGYALVLPPGTLPEGNHTIRVVARAAVDAPAGEAGAASPPAPELERRFTLRVERYDALPPEGQVRLGVPPAEAAFGLSLLERAAYQPHFTIVIAATADLASPGGTPNLASSTGTPTLAAIDATLQSLHGQVYREWSAQVFLPDAASQKAASGLASAIDRSGRVSLLTIASPADKPATKPNARSAAKPGRATPKGQQPAPETGLGTPSFVVSLRAGDRLGADALLELAITSASNRAATFIYADELRHDAAQARRQPFFKPDWSPELLLSMNYVGRPWCAADALVQQAALSPAKLVACSDYEAALRLTELAGAMPGGIIQVSRVLCDRGALEDGAADEQAAVHAALQRRGLQATVEPGDVPGTWRVRRDKAARVAGPRRPRGTVAGRVSIIMPTCAARGLVRTAIKTIRATSAPAVRGGCDVEIVILDNTPVRDTRTRAWLRRCADVVVDMPGAFNWSKFNNVGAQAATGEFLLFLNDDIEAREPGWLEAMLEQARRPEVGVVGARLLYPDGTVQHGGQYLADSHARHAFRFADRNTPGPFGLATVAREMISVTGACQMVRARVFADLGGFEEAHSVVNNDLDFCLRSWQAGLSVIYTPHATLVHHELASRATLEDSYDEARFRSTWRTRFLRGDPFRSPRLGLDTDHYGIDQEPAVTLHAGRRGPPADAVRRILAVKLDHIGDFLTALPALRSLKRRFPKARIDLLAPAASAELAKREKLVSETIVFDFFHARSGEGQKGVGEAEFRALAERLAPNHYDIAIDLRMQPETRLVLPHTGATFLAGYDHDNRFPFLDVALEWEGDSRLVAKRAHVSERLVQLVSATEDACREEEFPDDAPPLPAAKVPALAALPRAFLQRRLVCIHPGVGNVVRQWPAANYASLIDLLAEEGLHVVLIGGPEEATIAEDILRRIAVPGSAESVAGRVRLGQLPDVMRACVLFVGNNSGPKHIAASLGMPTIGIHSGVVDATEWAPLGRQAVAIRRQMICGPCYLEFASDCPRSLACLTGLRPRDVFAACRRLLV
jgi:ADP-heptose:LPS heptosyltransferase